VWTRESGGLVLTFHLAGINNQNFLMRDDQTGSYWQQITGEAVSGPLRGRRLTLVASDELSFGLWAAEVFALIGSPQKLLLVELGPGRGALMADALRAAKAVPEFYAAIDVHLIEASDILAELQREALAGCGRPVTWRRTIDDLPPGPAIFLANEFFDALPVRHYVKTAEGWREKLVGLGEEGQLAFGLSW